MESLNTKKEHSKHMCSLTVADFDKQALGLHKLQQVKSSDMELDPKCLSVNAMARMLHSVRSIILAHRWSYAVLEICTVARMLALY